MLTKEQKASIIREYCVNLVAASKLAEKYSVSRMAIYKILKKNKVNIKDQAKKKVKCSFCGCEFFKRRNEVRKVNSCFCSRACYYSSLQKIKPVYNRHGCRKARLIVERFIKLEPCYIVHHIDKDQSNNNLDNLIVFKSGSDHLRHHRGFKVTPIWQFPKLR